MSTFYRLSVALIVIACTAIGCQTTATSTPIPVAGTAVQSVNTPTEPPIKPVPTIAPTASPETSKNSSNKNNLGAGSRAYLGQTPPGLEPQVFAPGIVSIETATDYGGSFSPDGREFYFTRWIDKSETVIYETHLVDGDWTAPAPATFAAGYGAFEPHVTADGNTLYFGWAHSPQSEEKSTLEEGGIWATDRTAAGWSAPRYVGEGMFVSSDQSGQIYVTDIKTRSLSQVTLTAGRFAKLEYISAGIHPAITPDGSYLVYDNGDGNLRVRFRLADGKWSAAKDLMQQGLPASASIASISPDGQYLFYTDKGDLYWVSTELIKNLQ